MVLEAGKAESKMRADWASGAGRPVPCTCCFLTTQKGHRAPSGFFYKDPNPFVTQHLPKALPLCTSQWEFHFSPCVLGEHKHPGHCTPRTGFSRSLKT